MAAKTAIADSVVALAAAVAAAAAAALAAAVANVVVVVVSQPTAALQQRLRRQQNRKEPYITNREILQQTRALVLRGCCGGTGCGVSGGVAFFAENRENRQNTMMQTNSDTERCCGDAYVVALALRAVAAPSVVSPVERRSRKT